MRLLKLALRPIITLALLLAVIGAAAFVLPGFLSRQGWWPWHDPEITSSQLQASFKDVAELATQEYDFTRIGKYDSNGENSNVLNEWTDTTFLAEYSGYVKAGIKDITKIDFQVIDREKRLIITAPKVEVLTTYIDQSSVRKYDEKNFLFSPFEIDDASAFFATEESRATEAAVESGLLTKAQAVAEQILVTQAEKTLSGTQEQDYTVTVKWE